MSHVFCTSWIIAVGLSLHIWYFLVLLELHVNGLKYEI
jgi:hypothetical protein